MSPAQRKTAFEKLLGDIARRRAKALGLAYAGTLRKFPPPALPGSEMARTRYYLSAVAVEAGAKRLVELDGRDGETLFKAESWVQTGLNPPAVLAPAGRKKS